MRSTLCFIAAGACLVYSVSGSYGQSPDFVDNELVVILREDTHLPDHYQEGRLTGIESIDRIGTTDGVVGLRRFSTASALSQRTLVVTSVDKDARDRLLLEYSRNPTVESVERVELLQTVLTPNDPTWPSQWNYNASHLNAPAAWDIHTGTSNVILTIVDTGLDHQHPELSANVWSGVIPIGRDYCGSSYGGCGYTFGTYDNDPQHVGGDVHSHLLFRQL